MLNCDMEITLKTEKETNFNPASHKISTLGLVFDF